MRKYERCNKKLLFVVLVVGLHECATSPHAQLAEIQERDREIKRLSDSPSPENLQLLLPYLRSSNKNSRIKAAYALQAFAPYLDQVLPDLERAMLDPEAMVRSYTVFAISLMGSKGQPLLPTVRKLVSDKNEKVSAYAFSTLNAISGGKEGGCGMTEEQRQNLSLKAPEIPHGTALIFGNVGCAYTNDAIALVKSMNLKYQVFDLYRNSENTDLFYAHLAKLRIKNNTTIPIVIYDGRVFERPQKEGDMVLRK